MIIADIVGGLGNQLFQFAAAYALSQRSDQELALDTSTYRNPNYHNPEGYLLGKLFQISVPSAQLIDYLIVLGAAAPLKRLKHRLKPERFSSNFWREKELFSPDARFFQQYPFGHAYLHGWWQSEEYFQDIELEVRRLLVFQDSVISYEAKKLADVVRKQTSVSVHVRRGDYVTNSAYNRMYGTCSLSYYRKAMALMVEMYPDAVFYVFSDDKKWVASAEIFEDHRIVSISEHCGSWNDMYLMSQCSHHIIANSSFSWWGAWLNNKVGKTVLAPNRWFADGTPTPKLIPSDWIQVPG